jgi:hypothetical protein
MMDFRTQWEMPVPKRLDNSVENCARAVCRYEKRIDRLGHTRRPHGAPGSRRTVVAVAAEDKQQTNEE